MGAGNWQGITNWLSEHKTKAMSAAGMLILVLVLPVGIYLVQQQQRGRTEAWVCSNVQVTATSGGIFNVVVTVGQASWWRIIRMSNNEAVAGPQTSQVFNNLNLVNGEYQAQASDNQQTWTTTNCRFEIVNSAAASLECKEIKLYAESGAQIGVNNVIVGQTIRIAVTGQTNDPGGITKARFTFDNGANWQETTQTNQNGDFYVDRVIPNTTPIDIEAQVYNQTMGWR